MIHTSSEWLCRGDCGPWTPFWTALYITANIVICLSYIAIPFLLRRTYTRHRFVMGTLVQSLAWATFILACGLGHLIDGVLSFYWPHYPTFAVWHCLTATVSVYTALSFSRAISRRAAAEGIFLTTLRDYASESGDPKLAVLVDRYRQYRVGGESNRTH